MHDHMRLVLRSASLTLRTQALGCGTDCCLLNFLLVRKEELAAFSMSFLKNPFFPDLILQFIFVVSQVPTIDIWNGG